MASDFILHGFGGGDGSNPRSSLTLSGSTLYGTSDYGGVYDEGTIFQINTDGTEYQVLYNFAGGSTDGEYPYDTPTLSGSTVYGTASAGGNGTIFSLDVSSGGGLRQNAKDLGSGWKWLKWFGYFKTADSPWIYHQTLGWLYPFGTSTSTDSIRCYDPALNAFRWTSASVYPYVYRASDGHWLYYLVPGQGQ